MYIFNIFVLLLSYFDLNIAFDEMYIFDSSEENNNITFLQRGINFIFVPPVPNTSKRDENNQGAIQIVIFSACLVLLILIGLILFSICCKRYRQHHNLFTRSPSLNSIQELIRERLLDRPPTYHESQSTLNTYLNEEPPTYDETETNTTTEPSINSPVRIPTSPPIYTISSKMSTTYANNDLDLPYTECESDTDSPPSYHISEGVINPVLVETANNSITETEIESNSQRQHQNLSIHREFYI